MIRKMLAPVQAWILLQGKCVGCGRNLNLAHKTEKVDNTQIIICRCKRVYIFDKRTGKYRRAQTEETKNA